MNQSAIWQAVQSAEFPEAHIVTANFGSHRVDVFIPSDVSAQSPVLVMHDGKNVLFPQYSTLGVSWGILHSILNGAIRHSLPVVVSVWGTDADIHGARYFELAPEDVLDQHPQFWGNLLERADIKLGQLQGNSYQQFIATEVLPDVARLTGVRLERNRIAICGSSMGGLASLYGASKYPETYGTVLSLSTHWAFWAEGFMEKLLKLIPTHSRPRIWIDRGDLELDANYIGLHERATEYLINHGWAIGTMLQTQVFSGTGHNEGAWADRIAEVVNWWLTGIDYEADSA